jgi:translation initiation factor IF-3
VIDEKGVQLGTFDTYEAIRMAKDRGLDLVEVAPNSRPPVCKILDYGKLKYTKKKKSQEAKKKQSVVNVKEMQLRPRTEEHDFQTKLRHIIEFLRDDGDKVKVTVMFRGREVAYAQQGQEMLMRIIDAVKDFASPESMPKMEGRRMMMVLAPGKSASAKPQAQSAPSTPVTPKPEQKA